MVRLPYYSHRLKNKPKSPAKILTALLFSKDQFKASLRFFPALNLGTLLDGIVIVDFV